MNEAFQRLCQDNEIVRNIMSSGGTTEDCCVALNDAMQKLFSKAIDYMMIAPKKVRLPNGTVKIWHCPDELIPEISFDTVVHEYPEIGKAFAAHVEGKKGNQE